MALLEKLLNELTGFFALHDFVDMVKTRDFHALRTMAGIDAVISPLIPILLVFELIYTIIAKRFSPQQYKLPFLTIVFNRFMRHFVSIVLVTWLFAVLSPFAPIRTTITWYWLIYGYIVWELGHFAYHYFGHKVRIFWCLHAAHHTPEHMNLAVSQSHFFLEGAYADIIRTSVCALLGVNFPLLLFIMFIDTTWGAFIHIGENMMKNGRLGFLNRIIMTPSHHRVHHAKNPLYMDTNFCNLLNIWDHLFHTHRPELEEVKPVYGTTLETKGRFIPAYFGEFISLAKDVYKAPGLGNKLLYCIMPPGWSHTGDHKTSVIARREWLRENGMIQHPAQELKLEIATDTQAQTADIGMVQVSKALYKVKPENSKDIVDTDTPLDIRPSGKRIRR